MKGGLVPVAAAVRGKHGILHVLAEARSHPDGVGLGQQGIVSGFDFRRMERLCAHGASHQGTSNHKPAVAPQPGLERAAAALVAAAHVTHTVGANLQALLPGWSCAGAWPVGHCKQRARVGCRMAMQHRRTHGAEVQRNALLCFHTERLGCLKRLCNVQRLVGCCAQSVNRQCTQGRLTPHSCGNGWMACSQYKRSAMNFIYIFCCMGGNSTVILRATRAQAIHRSWHGGLRSCNQKV